jgi:hypothetical protein
MRLLYLGYLLAAGAATTLTWYLEGRRWEWIVGALVTVVVAELLRNTGAPLAVALGLLLYLTAAGLLGAGWGSYRTLATAALLLGVAALPLEHLLHWRTPWDWYRLVGIVGLGLLTVGAVASVTAGSKWLIPVWVVVFLLGLLLQLQRLPYPLEEEILVIPPLATPDDTLF